MADLLAYLAHHPNSGPRLARAAITVAEAMALYDWNADLWEDIARILDAATTGHLPGIDKPKRWKKVTRPSADPALIGQLSPTRYLVAWTIDVAHDAGTPEEAAKTALDLLADPTGTAHVFTVYDNHTATTTVVDLDDPTNTTALEN